jgi:hypothetical protein
MNGPVASIIVSLIVTVGLLFGTGAFKQTPPTYATVNFDGGYKKIGVIRSEEVFTEARVERNGNRLTSGTFQQVIDWIHESAKDQGGVESVTWKDGVTLKATAGIKWLASESNFTLTTDSLDLKSTEQDRIRLSEAIEKLRNLEAKAKRERVDNSRQALVFSDPPSESFLLSKILSGLERLAK